MASLLYYVKLCVSFQSHRLIETGVTFWKPSIRVTIGDFCPVWPWNLTDDLAKQKWHLFYATSSLVHHLMAMGEFKLELQSRNAQFYGKINNFFWRMTLKNNKAPSYATLSSVHHFIVICEFKLELSSANGLIGFWPHWPWPLTTDLCLLHGHHFWHG